MAFTAKDVQTLREKTGVGMMDCKKALAASDGDMEKAIDFLREKGLAAAAKKSTRIAAEGLVYAYVDNAKKVGVVIEVNSETDFVAKNADFQNFVKALAEKNPADVAALSALPYEGEQTVADALRDKILVIGENLSIRRFLRYEGDCVAYVHGGGRIGVLVRFDADAAASGSDALIEWQGCGDANRRSQRPVSGQEHRPGGSPGQGEGNPRGPDPERSQERQQARGHHCEDGGRPHRQVL